MNSAQQQRAWPGQGATGAAIGAQLLGLVVFAAWWLGSARVVQPIPGSPEMVQNAALCFVLLGTSLLLLRRWHTRPLWRRLAHTFAVVALTLATMTLIEYATDLDLGIDRTFLTSPLQHAGGFLARRMGLGSAAAFGLIALALLTLDARRAVRTDLSEVFALSAALVALTSAAGYLYGATWLYEAAVPDRGTAPHTVIGTLVLSAGVICIRPERPLMALVTSNQVGGFVIRRLLFGAFSIPVLGLLITVGLRRSLYDEPFAAALLAVAAMAIAVVLVLSTGKILNRIDTARTASERAVAEREERLRDLIQQASDGVFVADLTGRYTEVNDAGCKMLGYPRQDLIGKTIMDLIPAADLARLEASKAALLRGDAEVGEWTLLRRDGTRLPVEVSAKILPDGRWQGLVRDISARKTLERMREEWSSIVAHDLRQPVGIIAFEADRLGRMFNSGQRNEGSKVIERIRRSTNQLNAMINDLLDVSRLEARRLALDRTTTDLASLIDDAVDRLSSLVPGHRVRLRVQVRPAPAWVDAARFEQVLGNLISNAVKYGEPGGEIAVELATDESQFKVSVVNAGGGILPADIPALFERFARGRTTRGSGIPGLGLGLYICKGLVEAHGGRIWAESTPGEKTTFSFTVPMLSEAAKAAA